MRVGFVGLGNMGRPMAERLLQSGWDLTVHNRTPARTASLVEMGARFAGTVADLRDCDLVISMVGTDDDLRAIAVGPGGLFDAPRTGVLLVDCSTVSAEVTDEVAAAARAVGGDVLAAPVAGGPSVIPEGRLAIVCSGKQSAYQRAETVLESLAHRVMPNRSGRWPGTNRNDRALAMRSFIRRGSAAFPARCAARQGRAPRS
jgi:3-hydroxyisobutyrate dehydrogenase-like beta-hydroxyacid dehydrogenase